MEDLNKNKKVLEVNYLAIDLPSYQKDTVAKRISEDWLKLVKKDPYIAEASNVLADWIAIEKKNAVGKK